MQEAPEEGVKVELPGGIGNKDGQVAGLACIRNRLIEPDHSGRPITVSIDETYCMCCGLCMRRCPTGAIEMERFEILTPVYY